MTDDSREGGVPDPQGFGLINRVGYRLLRLAAFLTVRPYFRLSIEGAERIPRSGPVLFAPNHRSHIDPIVLQAAVSQRRIVYVMMRDWYDRPRLRPFFKAMRCIALEENGNNRRPLEEVAVRLSRGEALGIFPEGGLVADRRLGEFNHGVAALAARTSATIVPVAIIGSDDAYPRGAKRPYAKKVTIRIGEPIVMSEKLSEGRRHKLRDVTERLRSEVDALL